MSDARVVAAVLGDGSNTPAEHTQADILAVADGQFDMFVSGDEATKFREVLFEPALWSRLQLAVLHTPVSPAPVAPYSAPRTSDSRGPGAVSPGSAPQAAADPTSGGVQLSPSALDTYIRRYAATYQVDHLLIAAMIRHESNWHPGVVSSKGAIGLMQLMPGTAAMLGVDPTDPLENLRGGIAYLGGLLKTYKDVRLALIAYNAGPDHANRVVRGEVGLFPETQHYLDTINAVYALPEPRVP